MAGWCSGSIQPPARARGGGGTPRAQARWISWRPRAGSVNSRHGRGARHPAPGPSGRRDQQPASARLSAAGASAWSEGCGWAPVRARGRF